MVINEVQLAHETHAPELLSLHNERIAIRALSLLTTGLFISRLSLQCLYSPKVITLGHRCVAQTDLAVV